MALETGDVHRLNERARQVGEKIGCLRFIVAGNPEYVALVAGPDQTVVIGPGTLEDLTAHDIDLELDALEQGDRQLIFDDDIPRLI